MPWEKMGPDPKELPAVLRERLPVAPLREFCQRNPIQELWVFGSVLDDWKPESDVDLLVRFLPGSEPDFDRLCDLQEELAQIVGRKVDLVPADSVVNPFIKKHIREHRVLFYAT